MTHVTFQINVYGADTGTDGGTAVSELPYRDERPPAPPAWPTMRLFHPDEECDPGEEPAEGADDRSERRMTYPELGYDSATRAPESVPDEPAVPFEPAVPDQPPVADVLALEALAASFAPAVDQLSAADRERYAASSLRVWFDEVFAPQRLRDAESDKVRPSTLKGDRTAINVWTKWDRATAAPHGMPLRLLNLGYVEAWLESLAMGGAAIATLKNRWNHLRGPIAAAVERGLIAELPVPDLAAVVGRAKSAGVAPAKRRRPVAWTAAELAAIHRELGGETLVEHGGGRRRRRGPGLPFADDPYAAQLRGALILGLNCGARKVDLFLLRWGEHVRCEADPPEVLFTAGKTSRTLEDRVHWAPLHPTTVAHLERLRACGVPRVDGGLIFPDAISEECKDPKDSRAARRCVTAVKSAIGRAGLDVPGEPWQQLRRTCATRISPLLTHGKAPDVASQFYVDNRDEIVRRVMGNPIFAAFEDAG